MELAGINQALHEYLHLYIYTNICIQATAVITYSLFIIQSVSIMQSRKSENISDLSYIHTQGIVISQNAEPKTNQLEFYSHQLFANHFCNTWEFKVHLQMIL